MPLPDATSNVPRDGLIAGQYELRSRLGEGGFGVVFEAWDSKLQRRVAIKRIKEGAGASDDPVREARLAASLQHAAFVKVHTIADDGISQAIVMELVPGITIKSAIESAGVDLPTALDWVGQVADAMHDAHASGLVHGDLKPSNLMVEPGARVRILDFGLALRYDALATRSVPVEQPVGTIAYMAPERLHGTRPDAHSDIYALGVILYELTGGARPFAGLNGLALAAAHMQSSSAGWSYPDTASAPLVALIRAMTERLPQQRLGSMAEVRRRLRELDRVPGAAPARWQGARWRKAGAGALLVALLSAGVWQLAPFASALLARAAPYSQALEMRQGLDALKAYDLPGNLDLAERHFIRILEHAPDNAAAAAGMSIRYVLRYAGDDHDEIWLKKADASAQQALQLNEQLALSHVAMGWVRDSQGRHDQALLSFEQALRVDPGDFFAWYGKALVLRHARRHQQAVATLALASARFPQERVFWDELGTNRFEQADYPGAEQAFRRSLALQPDVVAGYANLNAALLYQNKSDEAMRVLQQGLQIRPSARLFGNLGKVLFDRGDYVGAAAAFDNAVSPTRGAPGEYLNWANLGDALLWIPGRKQDAVLAYDKARSLLAVRLARAPDDVLLVSRMGLYAVRAGDAATALPLLERAAALASGNGAAQHRIGLAYELLGYRHKALAAIASARRLGIPASLIEAEPDLVALRRDPAYPAQ